MILVTGANGFIGSALIWHLNSLGIKDIIATDLVDLNHRNLLKKRDYLDFYKSTELWSFLNTPEAQSKIEWIIHLGACSSTTEKNWDFLFENNFQYSQRLFEWSSQHQKNIIYASSAATYGAGENGFDDTFDSEKLKPLNLYGESKVLMDRWALKQTATPKHWYGLKFFNVFGPNEYEKGPMASVAFKSFHHLKNNDSLGLFKSYLPQYKDGEQVRDFVYVKDVVRWICEIMDKKPLNGIYNMGYGETRTWLKMATALFSALNKEIKINWLEMPEDIKNQYQYYTLANMQKWKSQGLSDPQWPLEKAIEDYVKNYLMQEDPWL